VRRKSDFKTYPELVDPDDKRGYEVVDIEEVRLEGQRDGVMGSTDKIKRIMAIPLTEEGEYIARHEMGHAKWSPKKKPTYRSWMMRGCMESCEEMRINQGLALLGIPVEIPDEEVDESAVAFTSALLNSQVVKAVLRILSSQGTNTGIALDKILDKYADDGDDNAVWIRTLVVNVNKRMARVRKNDAVPTFKQSERVARWAYRELKKVVKTEDGGEAQAKSVLRQMGLSFGASITKKKKFKPYQYKYKMMRGRWGGKDGSNYYDPKMSPFYGKSWGGTPPGELTVDTPRLTIPIIPPALERAMRCRSADEGTDFRYIHRFVSDQRVFRRRAKKRKGGGSVLIDTSGSMGLDDDDVDKIVEGAPEATKVATYSGSGEEGWVKIVVDKGKKYNGTMATSGHSNVVDLPALEWLSMQPEPRVWLSDGYVTGVNDGSNSAINKACNTIMANNNIVRVESVKEACRVLKREKDVGSSTSREEF
jgi:hypothetical protein